MNPVLLAWLGVVGVGLDLLGGLYLAYDLLGGQRGPLRTIARAVSYALVFAVFYTAGLSMPFGPAAGAGLGVLLGIEYGRHPGETQGLVFAVARGIVFGLAGLALHGWSYGLIFGAGAAIGLLVSYHARFSVAADYPSAGAPRVRADVARAQAVRALMVTAASVAAGLAVGQGADAVALFAVRLGVTSWLAGSIVGSVTPAVESWAKALPARRLGAAGAVLILCGLLTQSVQYWVVIVTGHSG